MAQQWVIAALFLVSALFVGGADAQCYDGWLKFGSSCYGFGQEFISWGDAAAICRIFDANLAEIESLDENNFIKGVFMNRSYPALWIGGTDIFKEGTWIWSGSKSPIAEFTDWFPGEPNHLEGPTAEDCLQFFRTENNQWNDETCSMNYPFVCEIPLEEEPAVGR